MKTRLYVEFVLPTKIIKRRKWFLSSCPLLDVHSQGATKRKALDNLREALRLFLVTCFERGTLENVLKECGFRPIEPETKATPFPKGSMVRVPVPFYVQSNGNTTECHA